MASPKGVNLAKHLGITPGRVSQLKAQGMPVDSYDRQSARAKRETHEANLAEMKERQALGELVEASRVTRAVTTWAAMARAAFEKMPDKLAERVAAEVDAQQCHALMTAEIDMVLADLAAGARSLKFDGDDGRA